MYSSFDGIKKIQIRTKPKPKIIRPVILKMDGVMLKNHPIIKTAVPKIAAPIVTFSVYKKKFFSFHLNLPKVFNLQKVAVSTAVIGLFFAFVFGAWVALNTNHSKADEEGLNKNQGQVLSTETSVPGGSIKLAGIAVPDAGSEPANNKTLFNTPLEYLQSYYAESTKPNIIDERTLKISQFLKDMHSPLVPASDTIARQDHWKLILSIGFAESTLGKNCSDNNCSNIGVGPSSSHWRKYATYSDWVKDFNGLLERRYKDWTLNEMCGVYVQPCNKNWLLATKQILDALKDRGIE